MKLKIEHNGLVFSVEEIIHNEHSKMYSRFEVRLIHSEHTETFIGETKHLVDAFRTIRDYPTRDKRFKISVMS